MATNILIKKSKLSFNKKSLSGFTLIEVLLIVAIISLLLILAFVAYSSQVEKARDAKNKSNIERIQIALEEYEKDNNCYPPGLPLCEVRDPGGFFHDYLTEMPCVPGTDGGNYYYHADPDGVGCRRWYWMFTVLEYEHDPTIEEIGCAYGCGPTEALADQFNYYEMSPNAPVPFIVSTPDVPLPPPPPGAGHYGCFSGVCGNSGWDFDTIPPGPDCHPNYPKNEDVDCEITEADELNCVDELGQPRNECAYSN